MNRTPNPDQALAATLGLGRKETRRRLWLLGGAVLLIAAALAWFALRGAPAHLYVTRPVTRGTLAVNVSATGTLAPRTQVDVGAEVSGRIDKLFVDFNDPVKKGQVSPSSTPTNTRPSCNRRKRRSPRPRRPSSRRH